MQTKWGGAIKTQQLLSTCGRSSKLLIKKHFPLLKLKGAEPYQGSARGRALGSNDALCYKGATP